jgi:hypothetical protein
MGNPRCAAPSRVYVGVDGTNVVISKVAFSVSRSNAPVSAVVAANCAVAEAYKHFTPSIRAFATEHAVLRLPLVENVDIGRVLLVGAGGISHGLAWVLQWLGFRRDRHVQPQLPEFLRPQPAEIHGMDGEAHLRR